MRITTMLYATAALVNVKWHKLIMCTYVNIQWLHKGVASCLTVVWLLQNNKSMDLLESYL